MAVSKRLRYEILRRDNHACRYCGATAPDVQLTVDHVTPTALGGSDAADNLAAACGPCNSGKTSTSPDAPLVADVSNDAIRWAEAMKQAADELRQQQGPKLEYRAAFENAWNGWSYQYDGKTHYFELPMGWKNSIENFRTAGLPIDVLPEIVETAMSNQTVKPYNLFRYCCGIAWRMIDELQGNARRIVGASTTASTTLSPLHQAVLAVWVYEWETDHDETVSEEDRATFTQSLAALAASGEYVAEETLFAAAHTGGHEKQTTIQKSIIAWAAETRTEVVIEWADAWVRLAGSAPDSFLYTVVQEQVDALAAASVPFSHIRRAALLAAFHHSFNLHHGLRDWELSNSQAWAQRQQLIDLWSRSFQRSADRWPTEAEEAGYVDAVERIYADGRFYLTDLLGAASAAGAYQDPDLTTCLPRHQSVFKAAAIPLQPAA